MLSAAHLCTFSPLAVSFFRYGWVPGLNTVLMMWCEQGFAQWYNDLFRKGNLHGSGIPRATTVSLKTILQGTLEGGQRRGRQGKYWMDNIKEWTSLPMPEPLIMASSRRKNRRGSLVNRPLCFPRDPLGQGTEMKWTESSFLFVHGGFLYLSHC